MGSASVAAPHGSRCKKAAGPAEVADHLPLQGSYDDMPRLVSALLTPRGLVAFWLVFAASFILMLWLVSPGRTLQDALTAELLQRHLAGGYQLRNPPLYEWLLWAVQHLTGPGPLSYLVLRYSLIAAAGILFYAAVRRAVATPALAASFSLSLVLFYWFGWEVHHSVSHTLALLVAGLALWIAALAYADKPTALKGTCPRARHRCRHHGQMELSAARPQSWRGARGGAVDAARLCRSAISARAGRRRPPHPAVPRLARAARHRLDCRPLGVAASGIDARSASRMGLQAFSPAWCWCFCPGSWWSRFLCGAVGGSRHPRTAPRRQHGSPSSPRARCSRSWPQASSR